MKKNKRYISAKRYEKNIKNKTKKNKRIKNKSVKKQKKQKKIKNFYGGTLFLSNLSDTTFENIVSIGFEFESGYSSYLIYDKSEEKYYLGDTYEIKNGRRKDERLFQINKIKSLSTKIYEEEFYSQEDEYSLVPSVINEDFQEQLKYYLDDEDYYEDNKDFLENEGIKIIKDDKNFSLITEVNDNPYDINGIKSYLNYKVAEYVITFYEIEKSKNPIMYYFKIALNMMLRYFKMIEDYNNEQPDAIILIRGSRPEYDMAKHCKIYKIPSRIHEYVPCDQELHNIEKNDKTIYDPNTEDKIIPEIEYNYLVEEDIKLSEITFSPQITIGIRPLKLMDVAYNLVNKPSNELFKYGLQFIDNIINAEIIDREIIEISHFDKNILSYVFYCSTMIYDEITRNDDMSKYVFKYVVPFLIRHKMSDFKIFKNFDFMDRIKILYDRIDNFDEEKCFYYLTLLIARDAYNAEMDYIGYENGDNASEKIRIIEEKRDVLNNFFESQKQIENKNLIERIETMYSTWNDMLIKQYPYLETETNENPLLFEIRFFGKDLNKIGRENRILNSTNDGDKQISIENMLKISSRVDDIIESSLQKIPQSTKKLKLSNKKNPEKPGL